MAALHKQSLQQDVGLHCHRLTLAAAFAYLPKPKNQDPRGVDISPFLVAAGVWRDRVSAARYVHAVVSEEARRADLRPTPATRSSETPAETVPNAAVRRNKAGPA